MSTETRVLPLDLTSLDFQPACDLGRLVRIEQDAPPCGNPAAYVVRKHHDQAPTKVITLLVCKPHLNQLLSVPYGECGGCHQTMSISEYLLSYEPIR